MKRIKGWFLKRVVSYAARAVAVGIKAANIPLLNAMIDRMKSLTIIDMVGFFARESKPKDGRPWIYSEGTVLEHLLSLGRFMGGYAQIWHDFLTQLQDEFDNPKENEK